MLKGKKIGWLRTGLLLFLIPGVLLSGDFDIEQAKKKLPELFGANNVGTEFWITIPPCNEETDGDNFIKIFVTTNSTTMINIAVPGKGYLEQKMSIPNDVVEFNITPSVGQCYSHSPEKLPPAEKVYRGYGIHIWGDQPLVVYCVVRYSGTSDGFIALPVSTLGRDYVVSSYGDMGSMYDGNYPSETGIVSPYDNNKVKFTLGGNVVTKTAGGLVPGKYDEKILDKGDVWMISSYGFEGDLSGSRIVADKPVSSVSGNYCANIPINNRWCDYSVEMDLPTYTWGYYYPVPKIHGRKYSSLIRIYAKENYTKIYRDGVQIGNLTETENGGTSGKGWTELRLIPMGQDPASAVISGDKPISVTLCNTGVEEDGNPKPNSDPFLMYITPVEQFQKEITFATPGVHGGQNFKENYLNLVYCLDSNGNMPDDIQFGYVSSGDYVWETIRTKFASYDERFRLDIDGRMYAVKNITLPGDGVYKIRAEKPFAVYSYGYGNCDSYGYPTSTALLDLEKADTSAPVPVWKLRCDGNTTSASVRDLPENSKGRSNMGTIFYDSENSYNYDFYHKEFVPGQVQEVSWGLEIIDPKLDARAVITFTDKSGNDTTIEIKHSAFNISVNPPYVNLGILKAGKDTTIKFVVKNLSEQSAVTVTRLELKSKDQNFQLDGVSLPFSLLPNETREVGVKFRPLTAGFYRDSLGIGDTCVFRCVSELASEVGEPVLQVSDINFGSSTVHKKVVKSFHIKNTGNVDAVITGYKGNYHSVYSHDLMTIDSAKPLILKPGGSGKSVEVQFNPDDEGKYDDSIVFVSDAGPQSDVKALITGVGIKPGLLANSYDWDSVRIYRTAHPVAPYDNNWVPGQPRAVWLQNNGTEDVVINSIKIVTVKGDSSAFKFQKDDFLVTLKPNDSLLVDVKFLPAKVGEHEINIIYNSNGGLNAMSVLRGTGIVPRVRTEDMDFGITLAKDNENIRKRKVKIWNVNYEWADSVTIADLLSTPSSTDISPVLSSLGTKGFAYDKATLFAKNNGKSVVIQPGDSIEIEAAFVARTDGLHQAVLTTSSDAEEEASSVWTGYGEMELLDIHNSTETPCVGTQGWLNIELTNLGTKSIEFTRLEFKPYVSVFSFDDPDVAQGFTLMPAEIKQILISFIPTDDQTESTSLVFHNDTKNYSDIEINLAGTGIRYKKETSVVPQTQVKTVGERAAVNIYLLDSGGSISMAGLDSMAMTIYYNNNFLIPDSIFLGEALATGYHFTEGSPQVNQVYNDSTGTITMMIKADEGKNFDVNGDLLGVEFRTYLPSSSSHIANISHSISTLTNECINITASGSGVIEMRDVCAGDKLKIIRNDKINGINLIKPNPVSDGGANVEYFTAREGWAEIKVYNATGELVMVPLAEWVKAGRHSLEFDTNNLTTGMYTVLFSAGTFIESRSFCVVK